jgi:hypothetical protein
MIEAGNSFCFALEALLPYGIRRELRGKDFDGYGAVQSRVARTVHFSHAPGAQRGNYFIGAELSAWGERHNVARL